MYDYEVVDMDHSCYGMTMICKHAQSVFDTRNATQGCGGDYIVIRGNRWHSDSLSANQEAEDSKLEDWWGL
jgi:hypothetical protein